MVPEIEDTTEIKLAGTKPFEQFNEAKALGVKTKPVVVGAFTLLKLIRYTDSKQAEDFCDDIIKAYSDLLAEFSKLDAEWVQFDEPYLVHDLNKEDIALFNKLYNGIISNKNL